VTRPRDEEDTSDDTKRAAICAAVLGVVLSVGALGYSGGRAALSVFVGATIAVANLLTMRAIIQSIVREPENEDGKETDEGSPEHREAGRRGGAAWGIFALLKIALLFGGVWFLLTRGLVDPIPLVVGYGVLPLGIAGQALIRGMSPKR
jgi:drug/metabolite transporter (DMT)-like permease